MYQLAEYWGLPGYLQNLAFENYKNIVQRGQWKTEDFLTSVNTILHPILPGDLSDVHEKENLKESRMVTPDCKTGASVYTLEYSQVPSYETRYSSFGIVSESPCYVLP